MISRDTSSIPPAALVSQGEATLNSGVVRMSPRPEKRALGWTVLLAASACPTARANGELEEIVRESSPPGAGFVTTSSPSKRADQASGVVWFTEASERTSLVLKSGANRLTSCQSVVGAVKSASATSPELAFQSGRIRLFPLHSSQEARSPTGEPVCWSTFVDLRKTVCQGVPR